MMKFYWNWKNIPVTNFLDERVTKVPWMLLAWISKPLFPAQINFDTENMSSLIHANYFSNQDNSEVLQGWIKIMSIVQLSCLCHLCIKTCNNQMETAIMYQSCSLLHFHTWWKKTLKLESFLRSLSPPSSSPSSPPSSSLHLSHQTVSTSPKYPADDWKGF